MKILKFLIAALLLVTGTILSAEQATKAQIEKLLTVTQTNQVVEQSIGQVTSMIQQQFMQLPQNEKMVNIKSKYITKFENKLKEQLKWEDLKPEYISLYQENFSKKEVQEMLDFYQSETGKVFLEKMPIISQRSVMITQSKVQKLMPSLMPINQEMRKEIEAALPQQRPQNTIPIKPSGN